MLPEPLDVVVDAPHDRLDLFLVSQVSGLSRSQAKRLIEDGSVTIDGAPGKPAQALKGGERVQLDWQPPAPSSLEPEAIPLNILYEDSHLLVIDKAAGMVVHPSRGHWTGTLVNALLAHCTDLSGLGGELRPGIVHRLDKDTTGLLVVAKHDLAHQHLALQFKEHTAGREYLALVYGHPEFDSTTVDAALARHPNDRTRIIVQTEGRAARTTLTVLERYGLGALVRAALQTGRTHQVRVHLNWLGHPVFGDPLYGVKRRRAWEPLPAAVVAALAQLPGQALHAAELRFQHPVDGRAMHFVTPPPAAFTALQTALQANPAAPAAPPPGLAADC